MKTTWKLFMFLLTATIALVSCEEDTLDPLTGMYTPPEVYDVTVLESQDRVKDGSLYTFSINLMDENANTLSMKLFATDYILPASDYTPSAEASKKTYLVGNDGTTFNGQQIIDGTLSIALQDSNYTISGILYLADATVLKLSGAFTYAYQPDPYIPTYTYTDEMVTPAMGGSQGATPIEGSTMHKITVYADDVFYAYLEIVADANAGSLSGTYSIKDGPDAVGQIGNGYYLDWSWWGGAGVMEGGSYYMNGDEKMFLREGDGTVTIADNGGVLSITADNLAILDLQTLISSNGATWTVLGTAGTMNIVEASILAGPQSYSYTNTITAPATYGWAGTAVEGSQLNVITVTNENDEVVGSFELITVEGASDLSGDYNVLDGSATAMAIGDANNGAYLDYSWWGMGTDIAHTGCWYVTNGTKNYVRAGSTIHVVDNGGVLSISGNGLALLDVETLISSSGATWQNLDATGSFSFSEIAAGSSSNAIALTNVIAASAMDLSAYGGTGYNVTLKLATEGVTGTYNAATWGYDFAGTGNYISLDFSRDAASLTAGTYNVVSNETAAVGDCIAGYPNPYGEGTWGSVWSTVTDGASADVAVASGTVDVAIDGDTYTITVDITTDEGAVKASYTGAITIQ
ncbi:autotransporter outer membrane beta-barrel domain-containing protein [Draconibacterium mangrovi]|uniref:hypothetical protein n=1 Tax=Draconibacterium mangrovi TaxID=2697469 RepID=UPI0013D1E13C|nr:hypothetical protein [Draconibacterium mangrovi]